MFSNDIDIVWRLLQYEKPVVKQAIEFGSKNEDTSLLCVAGFVIWKQGVNYIKNNASKTTLGISEDVVFEKDAKNILQGKGKQRRSTKHCRFWYKLMETIRKRQLEFFGHVMKNNGSGKPLITGKI